MLSSNILYSDQNSLYNPNFENIENCNNVTGNSSIIIKSTGINDMCSLNKAITSEFN